MQLLNGKLIANEIKNEIKLAVENRIKENKKIPHLAAILIGNDAASETYVNNKIKLCKEVGFEHTLIKRNIDITESQLLDQIERFNSASFIDGFIVQLPLPKHINDSLLMQAIDFRKDVDGFHPVNIGRMTQNLPCYVPATPFGIIQLLERYNIETEGKHCVVVGRSNIVGTPISILLSRNAKFGNCTVTLCHSKTKNVYKYMQSADILIAAIGKPHFVKANMVKEGAVVIDVGIHRISDANSAKGYQIIGDVDFNKVAPKCSYITPVPGGVGAMTVVSLLLNTLKAANKEVC